jgi:TRAP-type C4-dicarboxylate transport system permease small subunit
VSRAPAVAAIRSAIWHWAIVGGAILIALVLVTAASAISNLTVRRPFAGEYELAKHFVAIAIFMFLPYCQLVGANVTVDIFTEGMNTRAKAAMALVSSLFAALFAVVLLRQMSLGFVDYWRYGEVTPTLHLPLWTAFPPILISLILLFAGSLITGLDAWCEMRRAQSTPN